MQPTDSAAVVIPTNSSSIPDRRWRSIFFAIFLLALLARIPYYTTHHIQEDAYITFRSAFHLADLGDYSFNLGDRATGVTSTLYGPFVAFVRVSFRSHAIAAVSVLNTVIFLVGAGLLSCTLFSEWRKRALFFTAIAMLPSALLMSYAGMEIPLQATVFCAAIFTLRRGTPSWVTLLYILLLPLIRPDATAFSLILAVLVFSFDRLRGLLAVACAFAGAALVLIFNRLTTGKFITATMRAKEITYHPDHSVHGLLQRTALVLQHYSYLLPVDSKFLNSFGLLATVLVLAGCVAALWLVRRQPILLRLLLACFAGGVLVPAAYVVGGVIFPWYLWTSNWLCLSLMCFAAVYVLSNLDRRQQTILLAILALGWIGMDGLQWLVSRNIGLQEYHYRADVGRWLHQVAQPGDTLELEPAGYIPFYAGVRTYDEVGLISPEVLAYRQRYGKAWWMIFLKDKHPDWLVERDYVALQHMSMDGARFSPADEQWFDSHYKLVRRFHYSPANYLPPGVLLNLMKNGSHDDYFVYHYTDAQ